MPNQQFEYDFVISYASEDENFATAFNEALTNAGKKVFFAKAPQTQAELWGQNLYEYLAEIYRRKGLFFIPLISENYVNKEWPRHEWRNAQEPEPVLK